MALKRTKRSVSQGSASEPSRFDFDDLDELSKEFAQEDGSLDTSKLSRKERKALERAVTGKFSNYPHLMAMKPREGYMFRSDYFDVDSNVACILGFFHDDAAVDDFGAFWGINRLPSSIMGGDVTIVALEQVARMSEGWIQKKLNVSDRLDKLSEQEQVDSGTNSTRRESAKISQDAMIVAAELQDGAAYLHVHNRLYVKAKNVEMLDEVLERIKRWYIDKFGTLTASPYNGEQKQELSTLFSFNKFKRGKGFHYTSPEFAGSYNLVTNGLNDPAGEYVGRMVGDVNTSAVLFDVNHYDEHVVLADSTLNPLLGRARIVDMWGSKLSQAALMDNARVVHIVLNGADLNKLGPKFDRLTARVDMNTGDVNMFELFGELTRDKEGNIVVEDELSLFPTHIQKLVLMTLQAYEATDSDRSIITGKLEQTLTKFYVDQGMWDYNAADNRERLRLVGLDHRDVPRLQTFVTYLDTAYKSLVNRTARDDAELHAANILAIIFRNLLNNNGDLFNQPTSSRLDGVRDARRVIYDFSKLMMRGEGIAMAQLINIIGFAVSKLSEGDVVILHGCENIKDDVKEYLNTQFMRLKERGGRVVFLYNKVDTAVADRGFNDFIRADYTIFGPMTPVGVNEYQTAMGQMIPPDLGRLITAKGSNISYLRRGLSNVIFRTDLSLLLEDERDGSQASSATIGDKRRGRKSKLHRKKGGTKALSGAKRKRKTVGTGIESDDDDVLLVKAQQQSRDERFGEQKSNLERVYEQAEQQRQEDRELLGQKS